MPSDSTHTTQTEIERKYAVGDDARLPDLVGVGEPAGTPVTQARELPLVVLEAVYFDTADAALARARIALRRRRGGHDEGWHVKLPAAEGRTELQWPLDVGDGGGADAGGDETVPAPVLDAVREHVHDLPLSPLARITTTRKITELLDAAGVVVVEIADDTVSGVDAREGTVRLWREWEAELGPGAPATPAAREALLDEVGGRLYAAGAELSPSVSKLAQALGRTGLGVQEGASEADHSPSERSPVRTPETRAVRIVREGIAELAARVAALDPAVRADEPDALHAMRTNIRRLRTVLSVHQDLFDPHAVTALRDRLSRLGAMLGAARDLEVRADWAAQALDDLEAERGVSDPDARRRLVDDARVEYGEARARLLAFFSTPEYSRTLEALDGFAHGATGVRDAVGPEGARREAKRVLRKAGRRALDRSVKGDEAGKALGPDALDSARATAALHESRKAARRLRHAAEFSSDGPAAVLGDGAVELAGRAEQLQDALGWHRDASLFAEFALLTSRRADAAGESSFTYGVLYQRSIDQARHALRVAEDARRRLKRTI